MLRRFLILFAILLVLSISIGSFYLFIPNSFLSIDNRLRDFLFVARGSVDTTSSVVIIDIDEKSIHHYGQWPWARSLSAELIEKLTQLGAGIIGLDMVFSEDDSRVIINESNSSTPQICRHPNDSELAKVVSTSPVIGGYFFSFDFNSTDTPSIPAIFIERGLAKERYIPQPSGARLNIECIQDSFYSSGFFNIMPDESGVIRHVPLLMRYGDMLYPSLALEMLRIYHNSDRVIVQNSSTGADSITMGDLSIPIDRYARVALNYRGEGRHFEYISVLDIMEGRVNRDRIEGKFILIGTSAIGLSDLKATPMDPLMAGVEVHANVIDSILAGDFISTPHDEVLINLALITLTILSTALIFYFLSSWLIAPMWIAYIYGMYLLFDTLLFDEGVILNIISPLLAFILTTLTILLIRFIYANRLKHQFQEAFSRKVSPAVMRDIMTNETKHLLEPKEKIVTIFFSDIRSFTSISESMESPTRVISLLNRYMIPMVENIIKHHGTIDKFIGDAIMAYWNAPTDVKEHTDNAVQSALEQLDILDKLNIDIQREYGLSIDIGIGIHVGSVTIGEMGGSGRSDYTIIGDNVNLASRLEGLCKVYGVRLIISEATKEALTRDYIFKELDLVSVKGKKEAVKIFEVVSIGKDITPTQKNQIKEYNQALSLYRDGKFIEAKRAFEILDESYPSHLYKMYKHRCTLLDRENLKDFNGIYAFNTK